LTVPLSGEWKDGEKSARHVVIVTTIDNLLIKILSGPAWVLSGDASSLIIVGLEKDGGITIIGEPMWVGLIDL